MTRVDLRPATADDLGFIREVHHRAMRPYVEPLFGWTDGSESAKLEERLGWGSPFIITEDGQDVGWLLLVESDGVVKPSDINVEAGFRSQGIATAVLTGLLTELRRKKRL